MWLRPKLLACAIGGVATLILSSPEFGQGHAQRPVAGTEPYFGSLVGADALENFPIGGPRGGAFAYRFRSQWTGTVAAVRFFAILNPEGRTGYSGGTGGTFRISLVSDTGGKLGGPGRNVLASGDYVPAKENLFPRLRFETPAPVQRGRFYDVVFTNADPAPAQNYASIDTLFLERSRGARPPSLPAGVSLLWAYSSAGAPLRWERDRANSGDDYFPVVDIVGGAPGQHLGFGYMEVWSGNPKPIGGVSSVRQRFTFNRRRSARALTAWVRLRRASEAAPPLAISLETLSGRPLAVASATPSAVPSSSPGWVEVSFPDPPLLRPGQLVALVLRADVENAYEAFPLRDGSTFGFGHATVFPAGYAQFNAGGGWTGWDQWGQPDRHDGDLQFGLRLATPDP